MNTSGFLVWTCLTSGTHSPDFLLLHVKATMETLSFSETLGWSSDLWAQEWQSKEWEAVGDPGQVDLEVKKFVCHMGGDHSEVTHTEKEDAQRTRWGSRSYTHSFNFLKSPIIRESGPEKWSGLPRATQQD